MIIYQEHVFFSLRETLVLLVNAVMLIRYEVKPNSLTFGLLLDLDVLFFFVVDIFYH